MREKPKGSDRNTRQNITSILDTVNPSGGEVLGPPGAYTYQTGTNKLTHIEGTPPIDFGYDANANITTENAWTYNYDLSNQLVTVLNNSTQVAAYTYNGAGQRIKKVTQTETRIFHYDLRGHLIAETNQTGQTIAEYIYLGDQLLSMIKPGELVYYFHNDHLGTPQILTDDSQAIAWKAVYTPFGEAVASIQTVDNPFRFPGQYYDQETGVHYNYFHYYNPQTGRYITPDPIGLEGGINLFIYTENNPVNLIDPEGNTGWKPIPGQRKWRVRGERHPGVPYHFHFEYEGKELPKKYEPKKDELKPHGEGKCPGDKNKTVPREIIDAAKKMFKDRSWDSLYDPYDFDLPGGYPKIPPVRIIPSIPPEYITFP